MRLHLALLTITLAGCGGPKSSPPAASTAPAASGAAQDFGVTDDGTPGWVNRGSAAVTDDGRRVFYGVGSAAGIKNAPLLRQTADNRARTEIAKVFEVFSGSLMKDYMDSTGDQHVEQAVKTLTSASLVGVEIVDRYIAGDGTLYALAALDLQRAMDAVQRAKELGAVKSHVQKVSVDDIFDAHSKKRAAPPPRPSPVAGNESGPGDSSVPAPPPSASSGARTRTGTRPAWVDGADPSYPATQHLCGVGFGPQRTIAENGAYAALSRIFVARVASVSKDFMGAYSQTGAQSLEVQSSETLTKVSTGKVFSGVQLQEVWQGKDSTVYALACLDRGKAVRTLREQIAEADERAGHHLEKAVAADKGGKLQALARALDAIIEREALNGELRIVDPNGVGTSGPYSHADVADALETAVAALRVGVRAEGPYDAEFRNALIDGLTRRGYQVSDAGGGEGGLDVLVTATIEMQDGGHGTGSAKNLYFARAVVLLDLKNVAANKVIASFKENKQEGHRNTEEAERKAVRKLAQRLIDKVGAKIDNAMKGR